MNIGKVRAVLCVVISGLMWGTSGIFAPYLTGYGVTALQMTAIRGLVSFLIFFVYMALFKRQLFRVEKNHIPLFITAGLMMFLASATYYLSMQRTSVATSVMLMYTAPIFVLVYAAFNLGEKLTKTKIFCGIAVFIGCALVSGIIGGMKYDFLGIIMGIAAGLTYASYNIVTKVEMNKKVNPISASFYCYGAMSFFGLLFSKPLNIIKVAAENSIEVTFMMIGLGVMTFALPYFLYTLGLKALPAGVAACLGVIEPLAATLYSLIIFNQTLSLYQIIGIVLVLGAAVILGMADEPKKIKK